MKKYKNLWVFGPSTSTPGLCVEPRDSFWGLTATLLSTNEIINYSWVGNSLDSITHVLISEQNNYDWKNDFFLIGVPPLARLTIVSDDDKLVTVGHRFNSSSWQHDTFNVLCHHGMANIGVSQDKKFAIYEDGTWTQTQAMRTIFLLNAWLDSKNAKYLIINQSKDFYQDNSAVGDFLLAHCLNHPRDILFSGGYLSVNENINKPIDFDTYGWMGHHGPEGNKYLFEKTIVPALKKNKLI